MRLIISEKDKAASRIADILSNGKYKVLKRARVNVYDIGNWNGDETVIIPLSGHIVDVDFSEDFSSWKKTDLWDIVRAGFVYKPSRKDICSILREYGRNASEVVIATDFDREGEAIGREALDIIRSVNKNLTVRRARFSSITGKEIRDAFKEENLHDLDENLADSADARREIDLVWGAVLTRFISLVSKRLGRNFLSVGRVQTPTLGLMVNREKEILKFKPEKYWQITAGLKREKKFTARYKKEKIFDKNELDRVLQDLDGVKRGVVRSVKESIKKSSRPAPFNTNDFLRSAASLGISPARAMQIAENLYMSGLISYPRTDNTYYPKTLNIRSILKVIERTEFSDMAAEILEKKRISPSHGRKKSTDHPPIHPTGAARRSDLDKTSWRIYELIVRRFIATLSDDAKIKTKRIVFKIDGHEFISNGQVIVEPGWLKYYTYSKTKEVILPDLSVGDEVKVLEIKHEEKETQPPARYTPASLLKEMEKLGLGTKSTRPAIIQKLVTRGYITGTRSYKPSGVAFKVIDALEKHAELITEPDMTAQLERDMEKIAEKKKKKDAVVSESKKLLEKALHELEGNREAIGADLREGLREDRLKSRILGPCKSCNGQLVIRVSRSSGKRFAACNSYPDCNETYPLPQKGKIIPTGKICPKCGTPIIRVEFNRGKGRRYFEMCLDPNCPTKKGWKKK